jgi:hypothetical protein
METVFENLVSSSKLWKRFKDEISTGKKHFWKKTIIDSITSIESRFYQFDLTQAKKDLNNWIILLEILSIDGHISHKVNKQLDKYFDGVKYLHHLIDQINKKKILPDEIIKIDSFEFKRTMEFFNEELRGLFQQKFDWKIGATLLDKIMFNYQVSMETYQSLSREAIKGFNHQVDQIIVYSRGDDRYIYNDVISLTTVDLSEVSFGISRIQFGELYVSDGKIEDLWIFLINNRQTLIGGDFAFDFKQNIHDSQLLIYFENKLSQKKIGYKMNDHSCAHYDFFVSLSHHKFPNISQYFANLDPNGNEIRHSCLKS